MTKEDINEAAVKEYEAVGGDLNKAEEIAMKELDFLCDFENVGFITDEKMKEVDAFCDAVSGKEKTPEKLKSLDIDPMQIAECEKEIYAIFKDKSLNANTASLVLMGCIGNVLHITSKANGTSPTHEFNKFWFVMIDSFNKTAERLANTESNTKNTNAE